MSPRNREDYVRARDEQAERTRIEAVWKARRRFSDPDAFWLNEQVRTVRQLVLTPDRPAPERTVA